VENTGAGLAWVADERGDRIAAHEQAADDLAADAAGGADHCGAHRVCFRKARSAPGPPGLFGQGYASVRAMLQAWRRGWWPPLDKDLERL
jgi:hypothetical protein